MKRINLEIDEKIVKKIDKIAGFGHRNEWIRKALEEAIKKVVKK